MRFFSIPLFVVATAVSAATAFGPEQALTPSSADGAWQELPHIAMTQHGIAALWNGGATFAGTAPSKSAIAGTRALYLDPVLHRDGAIASIGDESLATWIENDWLYSRRIAADGTPIGSNLLLQQVDSRHTMRMAAAASSNEYLVVWPEWSRILATTLDAQGNSINWQASVTGGVYGRNIDKVAVASNGSTFLVVWEATSDEPWSVVCSMGCPSTDRDIHAVVVGADGNALTSTETTLATNSGMPDVAWTGTDYLVVWSTLPNGGIAGRHVAPDLSSIGAVQTFTTVNDFGPALASDGKVNVVAFARGGESGAPATLTALKINADDSTSVLSTTPLATGATPRQYAVAGNASGLAIAYANSGRILIRYFGEAVVVVPGRSRSVRH